MAKKIRVRYQNLLGWAVLVFIILGFVKVASAATYPAGIIYSDVSENGTVSAYDASYVLGDSLLPYSNQPALAKGQSYVDSTFHTTMTRVTDTKSDTAFKYWGTQAGYPTWNPLSSDGNYLILQELADPYGGPGYALYDANTYQYLGFLDAALGWNTQDAEPRWDRSGQHPSWIYFRKDMQIRYYDVASKTEGLIHDFSNDFPDYKTGYYIYSGEKGSPSLNGRYWAYMVQQEVVPYQVPLMFVYDMQANKVVSSHPFPNTSKFVSGNPHEVMMSPSGNYIYVAYFWGGGDPALAGTEYDGPHAYSRDFSKNVKVFSDIPHANFVYSKQGNEGIIGLDTSCDMLRFTRLDTGQHWHLYKQVDLGWGVDHYYTYPGSSKVGWAFVSSGYFSNTAHWDDNEIFAVEVDETKGTPFANSSPNSYCPDPPAGVRIWRVAFTQNIEFEIGDSRPDPTTPGRTYTDRNYYQQPNATMDYDGKKIYFGANWRDGFAPHEIYQVTLPATWWQDLSGATPAGIIYGDVSENGSVTAYDASLAAQYAVGLITLTSTQITKANVSGSGSVSAYDASLIAQRAVGLIDKFPVETTPTPLPTVLGAPAILFTDIDSGPNSGGPHNSGVPISIFGKNFGATKGKVSIGGVDVSEHILVWGTHNAHNGDLDMIVVQPGTGISGSSQPIAVIVNGKSSNTDKTFTVREGAIYLVSTTGSDDNNCSLTSPCKTISHVAQDIMQPGDTLLVSGGTYNNEDIWIRGDQNMSGTPGKPKVIKNYPGQEVVENLDSFSVDADYITVSGLTVPSGKSIDLVGWSSLNQTGDKLINNAFRGYMAWAAISTSGNNYVLAGNDCQAGGSSQGTQGHCYYIESSNTQILYNTASGEGGYGIHIFDEVRQANDYQRAYSNILIEGNILKSSPERSGIIIEMDDCVGYDNKCHNNYINGVIIRNNIFTANNFNGITIGSGGGTVKNIKIYNNTFYENGRQGIDIGDSANISDVDIRNNLIYQSASNANCINNCSWYAPAHISIGPAAKNITVSNNYYGPESPVFVDDSGNNIAVKDASPITGAVRFVNPSMLDFHVWPGSANINKGLSLPDVLKDYDGTTRPQDGNYDIGAFER